MIWRRHVHHQVAAFVDDALGAQASAAVERHLSTCESCRRAVDQHRSVAAILRDMQPVSAPADLWAAIESAMATPATDPVRRGRPWMARPVFRAAALATLVLLTAATWWYVSRPSPWAVVRLDGQAAGRIHDGQWVETDNASTAAIRIGEIGRVDISPDTRLQLLSAEPNEHRLSLAYGRISVEIVAPPRVFFVETPMSTVVDLGCAYTMDVNPAGVGTLRVTSGWAALEWNGLVSLVPAGASAHTRPSFGPGTPVFDDASDAFREAVDVFDGDAGEGAIATILSEARDRDTLTLWHLMWRVEPGDRVRVLDHVATLTPLPEGVTRDGVLALDETMMRVWREELAWTW
jgi:hypothetical protein